MTGLGGAGWPGPAEEEASRPSSRLVLPLGLPLQLLCSPCPRPLASQWVPGVQLCVFPLPSPQPRPTLLLMPVPTGLFTSPRSLFVPFGPEHWVRPGTPACPPFLWLHPSSPAAQFLAGALRPPVLHPSLSASLEEKPLTCVAFGMEGRAGHDSRGPTLLPQSWGFCVGDFCVSYFFLTFGV